MISPQEVHDRARKLWSSGRALRAWLGAEPLFPYSVPFRKPTAGEWLENFAQLRADIDRLEAASRARRGAGYAVIFRETAHQKLGRVRTPERVVFESVEDLAACAGESEALRRFQALAHELQAREPQLADWLAARPLEALAHESVMPQLLAVVTYFRAHPRPMRYARELGIPGVDSKFIEAHRGLLGDWLERLLPAAAVDRSVRGLSDGGFERRFGLRCEEPLMRLRWLDPSQALGGHVTDATVPLSQLASYNPRADRVFVTENKVNFLTLPDAERALVLFGGGYAIELLAAVPWLRGLAVHYWGDIDTHGFAILSQLRNHLPHVRSFLMDRDTLVRHREVWGEELRERRCVRDLPQLDAQEQSLYDDLRADRIAERLRLEQERVAYACVAEAVRAAR